MELMELMELMGQTDHLVETDQTEVLDHLEHQDQEVVMEEVVHLDLMVHLDHLDRLDHLVCKGQRRGLPMHSNRYQVHNRITHKLEGVEEDGGVKVDEDQKFKNK